MGVRQLFRIFQSETKAFLDIVRHHQEALLDRKDSVPVTKSASPVLLLHGYLVGAPSLLGQERYLRKKGFAASSLSYPFWQDLRKVRASLEWELGELCWQSGQKVSLVGHSEGGLVSYSLAQHQPECIDRVIALGTPFQGTLAAYLNFFVESAQQMLPGSSYLREMAERGVPDVPVISISTKYDELVIPWHSALLPESRHTYNVECSSVGHGGLITRTCYPLVEEWLRKIYFGQ
ncbi:MAG: hypothetical protein Q8R53_05225 [Nanoarchaeota archaeon]|nr:hypothetical protein [Nanoarchaeota archaeon]